MASEDPNRLDSISSREGADAADALTDGIRSSEQVVAPIPGDPDELHAARVVDTEGDALPADARVAQLLEHSIDVPRLAAAVEQQEPADAADTLEEIVEEFDEGEAGDLLVAMDDRKAADALAEMELPLAVGVIEDLLAEDRSDYAVTLIQLMQPDDAVDLLGELDDERREQVLVGMPAASAAGLRRLLGFDDETAAGLMTTSFVTVGEALTIGQATERLRGSNLPEDMTHLPVVSADGRLVGVISLRALLLSADDRVVGAIMYRKPRAIRADLDQEEVARQFDRHDHQMMPVVDDAGHVLGIVTVDDVIDIIREEQTEDVQRTVGAGKEEAVYSGVLEKFRGRFPWLAISLLMMVPSALVVRNFEGLIGDLAILAVLMPIIAAVTGNAGHQALAVTLRGIVLDEVRPGRVLPLMRREAIAGLMNGTAIGLTLLLGVVVVGLFDPAVSWRVGVVAGSAIGGAIAAGSIAGTAVPLAMRRFGADPAHASTIFLIMITDAVAFATFLGLAGLTATWLQTSATSVAATGGIPGVG